MTARAQAGLPISVVIPAHDRERLVRRALESVAAQRPVTPAEVIVVDDGSTDGTAAVAEELGATVIRHERNRGSSAARNTGIAAASQPWIAFLDSDDEWLPHYLATLWPLRADHVLVAGSFLFVAEGSDDHRFVGTVRRDAEVLDSPATVVWPENPLPSGLMVRSDVVRNVGGYTTTARHVEDLDLWVRVLEHGTGVIAPTVTSIYHGHAGQKSRDKAAMHDWHRTVIEAYSDRAWWSPALLQRRAGVQLWDEFRAAWAQRDVSRARAVARLARVGAHPERVRGLATLWSRRLRARRRSSATARDGSLSVAILPGASPAAPIDGAARDYRGRGRLRALAELARRPTGSAVVASRAQAVALRALGIRPLYPGSEDAPPPSSNHSTAS